MLKQIAVFFLVALCTLFSSCERRNATESGKQVFSYNEMAGLSSLDPAAASNFENIWPVHQLFNGLLQMDDSLNVVPSIARAWEVSEDGLQYIFQLRTDVYFHKNACFPDSIGRTVTAHDFVFSFKRLYDSKVSSATTLLGVIAADGFRADNDSTLVIKLQRPFSAFPSMLTMKFFSVIPREAIEKYGQDFRRHPVGTGPFMFKAWNEGVKLIMVKNQQYFERDRKGEHLPYLDAVAVSFIRDRETAFMELLSGRFDMISGADAFNVNEVLDREGKLADPYDKKFYLQKAPFLKTDYIGILVGDSITAVQTSPLRLKAVRQAINCAFDRARLTKYLRNNVGVPAHAGFIPPGLKSHGGDEMDGYRYDPARVQQLLAEAGYPRGSKLPTLTLHVSESYKDQAEFIQSQLAAQGIAVEVSVEKTSVMRQATANARFLLFRKSWFADYPDEENFMSLFYSRNAAPAGVNFFHYANKEFDALFERVQSENDPAEKTKLYREMDKLVMDDAPVIPLYYDEAVRLVRNGISGLTTNPMNLLDLRRVQKN